ncbi:aromatic amino acid lyase [Streptomyces sp. PsTaAH-124]|uniref:aromatic amino acid lyase n=1 Tax=Streptomyces sp. PsTaAH-124 TaxID=1157638 RepID=UPI000361F456|nr:aromatic amino acid lyase [Streptomyces sp. PsTaAH-124]
MIANTVSVAEAWRTMLAGGGHRVLIPLPSDIVPVAEAGLHHGFKGMQIAASAITAEALKQTGPASVFSRSTESHNQDIVSMGTIAARDARTVNGLVREVAAIHLLALAQAVELRGVERAAPALRAVHALIREHSAFVSHDRGLDRDIAAVCRLIETGDLRRAAGFADDGPVRDDRSTATERYATEEFA